MNDLLDEFEHPPVKYVGFWPRFGALFLDGLIFIPFTLPLTYFNNSSWNSSLILVLINLVPLIYKPFMEYRYGASLGKMILKIKVTNGHFEHPSLQQILFRNIFYIGLGLISLFIELAYFDVDALNQINKVSDLFSTGANNNAWNTYFSFFSFLLYLTDAIFIWTDEKKRSLHDRIANTYIVTKT